MVESDPEDRLEPYSVLYEDEDILIANKLSPLPVLPEKSKDASLQELLRAFLSERDGSPAFLEAAHRVDRRASGAVLFAKTRKSLSTLEAAFRAREVEKDYVACVEREPVPPEGRLEHRLVWDKRRNVVRAIAAQCSAAAQCAAAERGAAPRGKDAVLEYRLAGRSDRYFFVEARLITGRHHQIRAQLSAIGCPIRGDLKYGARRGTESGLIMLHSRRIALNQPRTGARVEVAAPFPESEPLWKAFEG
jgi:23S rRNA pseudouridine1911/1915/1917 synthase